MQSQGSWEKVLRDSNKRSWRSMVGKMFCLFYKAYVKNMSPVRCHLQCCATMPPAFQCRTGRPGRNAFCPSGLSASARETHIWQNSDSERGLADLTQTLSRSGTPIMGADITSHFPRHMCCLDSMSAAPMWSPGRQIVHVMLPLNGPTWAVFVYGGESHLTRCWPSDLTVTVLSKCPRTGMRIFMAQLDCPQIQLIDGFWSHTRAPHTP